MNNPTSAARGTINVSRATRPSRSKITCAFASQPRTTLPEKSGQESMQRAQLQHQAASAPHRCCFTTLGVQRVWQHATHRTAAMTKNLVHDGTVHGGRRGSNEALHFRLLPQCLGHNTPPLPICLQPHGLHPCRCPVRLASTSMNNTPPQTLHNLLQLLPRSAAACDTRWLLLLQAEQSASVQVRRSRYCRLTDSVEISSSEHSSHLSRHKSLLSATRQKQEQARARCAAHSSFHHTRCTRSVLHASGCPECALLGKRVLYRRPLTDPPLPFSPLV